MKINRTVQAVLLSVDPNGCDLQPIRVYAERLQLLMDDLWRLGIRPTDGNGSIGALAATERHLEDMRRLVFAAQPGGARTSDTTVHRPT